MELLPVPKKPRPIPICLICRRLIKKLIAKMTPIIATRLMGNGKSLDSVKPIASAMASQIIWFRRNRFVWASTTTPWSFVLK
jgi:hypothetical protein